MAIFVLDHPDALVPSTWFPKPPGWAAFRRLRRERPGGDDLDPLNLWGRIGVDLWR
jgi:hypothetical protein